ncbi:hypothetical protein [Streptomyces atratus]|uniref:hypothetical protein n=1 Tax=Streptomyces atratus TaxID=1893 RepID=UPI003F69E2B9
MPGGGIDGGLPPLADAAAQAAARLQHQQRTGRSADSGGQAVTRLLTVPTQWEHARAVLAHVADHSPLPGPEARLLVVMLTLRTAHAGTGNLVGQDITALSLTDPEHLVEKMTDCGWLSIPGTAGDLQGPNHPDTLAARNNLAAWRGEAGDAAGGVRV